jgi:archaellum component FlaC
MSQGIIAEYLPAILIAIGFGAQAFVQWRSGINKGQQEGLDNYKKVAESYEKRIEVMSDEHKAQLERLDKNHRETIAAMQLQVNSLTEKVGTMKGQLDEKDKRLQEYLQIFQERDPDSKKVVDFVGQVGNDIQKFHDDNLIMKTDIQQVKDQVGALHQFLLAKTIPSVAVPPKTPQNPA